MNYTDHGILQVRIPLEYPLEWVAFSFSSRSSQPGDQTQVSCIAGGFFTSQAIREAQQLLLSVLIRYGLSNPFLWEDREESKQPKDLCIFAYLSNK